VEDVDDDDEAEFGDAEDDDDAATQTKPAEGERRSVADVDVTEADPY
jgi:hypothetical protein